MRTEYEIIQDLSGAKQAYNDGVRTLSVEQSEKLANKIWWLTKELRACLSEGAKGENVFGMRVETYGGGIEVGDGEKRSRGKTKEEAVANWNNKVYWIKPE